MAQYQVYFDTLEGERKYNVDIGDDEPIEQVLRDILGELSERGHMMKGLSTGDLKVVWGGARAASSICRARCPSRACGPTTSCACSSRFTRAAAGSLRRDRVEREWTLLERLARANPHMLDVVIAALDLRGRASTCACSRARASSAWTAIAW